MPLDEDEMEGNLYACAQQFFQLCQCNHNKIKQIIWMALSDELGLGFGGKALPEARKATEGFVEMAVHCLKAPAEPFKPESEEDLGGLYPVDLPDAMTEKETTMYIGKQEGPGLALLSSFTTFKNNANSLWVMEKSEEQAEKGRATALEKEHQNVKGKGQNMIGIKVIRHVKANEDGKCTKYDKYGFAHEQEIKQ
ncbi:hypothetical protein EDD16DRAFT_1517370 [Pisolithus croceorrhizus]|nr:hypothetical protein EDD16DRAFT_1517370 [Pisolithus croceorrhizus]